jgi:preprotein translocase subunit SecG
MVDAESRMVLIVRRVDAGRRAMAQRILVGSVSRRVAPSAARRAGTAVRTSHQPSSIQGRMLETILSVVQVAICIVLIFLVLMHSGKDAGLSGAFGVGSGQGSLGGGSLVERNLNRWTVLFAVLFAINTIVLLKIS